MTPAQWRCSHPNSANNLFASSCGSLAFDHRHLPLALASTNKSLAQMNKFPDGVKLT